MNNNPALAVLRHHVSGAIARGEKEAITERPTMHTHNMLEVINPSACGADYCKRYINGRLTNRTRWDLCDCHARMGGALECYKTEIKKDGRIFHRHIARCSIDFSHTRTRPDLSNRLPVRDGVESLTYHRNPTPAEIRFGEGATHYLDFAIDECCHEGTRIPKRWVIGRLDGLRYYR